MSGSCARITAVFFGFLFIIAAISSLILFQLEYTFLSPEPYIDALQADGLAGRVTQIASRELAASLEQDPCFASLELCDRAGGPPAYLIRLSQQDWELILAKVITPGWVRDQAELVIRGLFQSIDGDGTVTPVSINLRPIKINLSGETGSEIIKIILGSLPECTSAQIEDMTRLFLTGGEIDQLLICSPPPDLQEIGLPILVRQVDVVAGELPDEVPIRLGESGVGFDLQRGVQLERAHKAILRGLFLSGSLTAFFLLVTLAFAVRSLRDLFVWTGWPLMAAGLIGAGLVFAARASSTLFFDNLIVSVEAPALQSGTVDFIRDLFEAVVRSVLSEAAYISAGSFIAGTVLLIVSRFFPSSGQPLEVNRRPGNLY